MKTATITLLLMTLLLGVHSDGQNTPKPTVSSAESNAMGKVMGLRFAAKWQNSSITIDHGKATEFKYHLAEALARLKKIETTDCPSAFRLAWFDYIAACEAKTTEGRRGLRSGVIDLAEVIPAGSATLPYNIGDMVQRGEPKEVREAWIKVERACLELGFDTRKLKFSEMN